MAAPRVEGIAPTFQRKRSDNGVLTMRVNRDDIKRRVTRTRNRIGRVLGSYNVLFQAPGKEGLRTFDSEYLDFFNYYRGSLIAVESDLAALSEDFGTARRRHSVVGVDPDGVDHLNALVELSEGRPFKEVLEFGIIDVMTERGLYERLATEAPGDDDSLLFLVRHAGIICGDGVKVFSDYLRLLDELDGARNAVTRVKPALNSALSSGGMFTLRRGRITEKTMELLRSKANEIDPFFSGKAFRYMGNEFFTANLSSIRPVDRFFGFHDARLKFKRYFNDFALGKTNLPLLISSLPGLGKTHFTISHVLAHDNLTLILPEPTDLENELENLIRILAKRKNNRFVLFFDDVDTRNVNWYYFRTHVGGSFSLPDNIAVVIATNYQFPANISSRGRGFTFPIFDEVSCQEMIADFLKSMGMRNPTTELVSVIAADYVENFGQKIFEELSPRTLVRYLEVYERDARKRKAMLDLSREDVITTPDAQTFYEVNTKLVKSLYGEDYAEEVWKQRYLDDEYDAW